MTSPLIWIDLRPPSHQKAFPRQLNRQLGASEVLELLPGSSALTGQGHAAGAACAKHWQANHKDRTPPLLIGVGLASRDVLAGLAQQFQTGCCLLLDAAASNQKLGDLVALLASATRIVTANPAIRPSWELLLRQEWDAEQENPRQWQHATSPRQLLAIALEAQALGQATWQQLSQQQIPLAWNRAHLAYGKLAPNLQPPAAQNLAVNVGLASSGFQPRWLSPQQACQTTGKFLELCGLWNNIQILPRVVAAKPYPLPTYAVHLHAHHLPESAVILARLAQLSHQPAQLILTGSNGQQLQQALTPQLSRFHNTSIQIISVPNQGRNIGALMAIAARVQPRLLLHLHSKDTSPQDPSHFIHHWLEFLISSLFSRLPATLQALAAGHQAAAFPIDPHRRQLGRNAAVLQQLIDHHQHNQPPRIHLRSNDAFVFPLGMMLWLEKSFLLEQLKPLYSAIDPKALREPLATDGTALHGLERAIPLIVALEERSVLLIEPPEGVSR